jgi:hypothetical protein
MPGGKGDPARLPAFVKALHDSTEMSLGGAKNTLTYGPLNNTIMLPQVSKTIWLVIDVGQGDHPSESSQ